MIKTIMCKYSVLRVNKLTCCCTVERFLGAYFFGVVSLSNYFVTSVLVSDFFLLSVFTIIANFARVLSNRNVLKHT